MLRTGYWLDLETLEFTALTGPTYQPFQQSPLPNEMFSFRGRPTIFGNKRCDDDLNCVDDEVLQYDPEEDEWVPIGTMFQARCGKYRDRELRENLC